MGNNPRANRLPHGHNEVQKLRSVFVLIATRVQNLLKAVRTDISAYRVRRDWPRWGGVRAMWMPNTAFRIEDMK